MDRAANMRSANGAARAESARDTSDARVVVFPLRRPANAKPGGPEQYVSDAEIAQLVSLALEDALVALGDPDPETCLRLRAYEARAGIREMLSALPRAKARDAALQDEYRRAIVFQNLTLDLALKLVGSIRRYARVYEREIPAAHA